MRALFVLIVILSHTLMFSYELSAEEVVKGASEEVEDVCQETFIQSRDLILQRPERNPTVSLALLALFGIAGYSADQADAISHRMGRLGKEKGAKLSALVAEREHQERVREKKLKQGKFTDRIEREIQRVTGAINRMGVSKETIDSISKFLKNTTWPLKLGRRAGQVGLASYEGYLCIVDARSNLCTGEFYDSLLDQFNETLYEFADGVSSNLGDSTITGAYLNNPYLITAMISSGNSTLEQTCSFVAGYPELLSNLDIMRQLVAFYRLERFSTELVEN